MWLDMMPLPGLFHDMIAVQGLYTVAAFDYLLNCMEGNARQYAEQQQIEQWLCINAWINE
jgi:hypothetical protein